VYSCSVWEAIVCVLLLFLESRDALALFIPDDTHLAQFLQPFVLTSLKDFTCTTEGNSREQTELSFDVRDAPSAPSK
jgi:hypothetical protein